MTKANEENKARPDDDRPDDRDRKSSKAKGRGDDADDGDDDGNGKDNVRALDAAKRVGPRPAGFLSIHKKGQGYWTRMGTLIGVALVGGLLAWTLHDQIPKSFFNSPFDAEKQATAQANEAQEKVRTAQADIAASRQPGGRELPPAELAQKEQVAASNQKTVTAKTDEASALARDRSALGTRVGIGIAVGFLVVYAFFAVRLMNKPSNVDFLIATDTEMKKVNWTSRKELIGSSKVVILFMVLIAVYLFLNDTIFGYLMYLIGVLKLKPPPFT